jgi:cyclophilin family peptidyl-prolyl cis-trans isomerase
MKKIYSLLMVLSFALLTACGQTPEEEISKVFQDGPPETVLDNQTTMAEFDQTASPEAGDQIAVIETNMGIIKIRLFPTKVPKTVENFVGLIEKEYYNGIIFHRVIPDFMIQGGDPTGTGTGGESLWGGKFEDEFHPDLKNIRGALSMANAGPNTNGSQFFIVQAEATPWLDGLHSVFGQVFEGMDVVDAIAKVDRDGRDKPLEDVVMEKVTVEVYE